MLNLWVRAGMAVLLVGAVAFVATDVTREEGAVHLLSEDSVETEAVSDSDEVREKILRSETSRKREFREEQKSESEENSATWDYFEKKLALMNEDAEVKALREEVKMRRDADTHKTLRHALKMRIMVIEMSQKIQRLKQQASELLADSADDAQLAKILAQMAQLETLKEEAGALYAKVAAAVDAAATEDEILLYDDEIKGFMAHAREQFAAFWGTQPEHTMDQGWEEKKHTHMRERLAGRIGELQREIMEARRFVAQHKDGDMEELSALLVSANTTLENLKTEVASGEYDIEKSFNLLERVGRALEVKMKRIQEYAERSFSVEGSAEDLEAAYGDSGKKVARVFSRTLDGDAYNALLSHLNEDDIARVASLSDDADIRAAVARILQRMNVLDKKGARLLSNSLSVYEEMKGILKDAPIRVRELYALTMQSAISSEVAADLAVAWHDLREAILAGERELSEYIATLEELLKKNRAALVHGDDAVAFEDVPFEEDRWYYGPVQAAREAGIVKGYSGAKMGYFGPSDAVTYAEALKMSLQVAGVQVTESSGEKWFLPYVKAARQKGYRFVEQIGDFNAPASRRDVAVMIAEVLGLSQREYRGVYPDVSAGDADAGYYQAVYDEGLMTGQGNGRFDGLAKINRAEAAKVMVRARMVREDISDSLL